MCKIGFKISIYDGFVFQKWRKFNFDESVEDTCEKIGVEYQQNYTQQWSHHQIKKISWVIVTKQAEHIG